MELEQTTAVVTGAGRGIGRSLALGLAAAGAKVVVAARTASGVEETVRLIDEQGGRAVAVPTDVTDWTAVNDLMERTADVFGAPNLWSTMREGAGPSAPCDR